MNLRFLLLAMTYTLVLAACASVPVNVENSSFAETVQLKQQTQETTISLEADQLRHPHFLCVSTTKTGTQLTGKIELNGKFIQSLNNKTKINLSPYLGLGKHKINISARYRPTGDSVQIEFIGPNTQVSQQTGGSGYVNQRLIIEVQ
ncbi:MAG: hypothetical protein HC847_11090 [Hydrococcus sp. RU_2_2]|nr:hypothetical protein [Hydrococcus sp. RU_2_2]NJP20948.1 hypothetical protein [Hydrococcus sp. CRU_1_1]